jgi:hypothetical protein
MVSGGESDKAMRFNAIDVIDPQSDPRWDAVVAAHPSGWITRLSEWKRVLEASFPRMKGIAPVRSEGPTAPVRAGLPLFLDTPCGRAPDSRRETLGNLIYRRLG